MSHTVQTTIWCDRDGCENWYQIDTTSDQEAKSHAREAGWVRETESNLCPGCSDK